MNKYLVFLLFLLLINHSFAQDITPLQYFGDSYNEAISYCEKKKMEINTIVSNYGISSEEAISIVFPEIIRYNRFQDFAETTSLEIAYVQGGRAIADFSIGRFQMKPSFVECLEQELLSYNDLLLKFKDVVTYETDASVEYIRSERIERLKQESWQLKYLACFIRLAEKRFAKELSDKPTERLLILSSAYNKGLNSSYSDLKMLSEKKTFPYGNAKTGRFSYYDVANYFKIFNASLTLKPNP